MPKYSIIVPTYNMSHYLSGCIESICKQTFQDFEVILVDDCSTDDSYQICLDAREIDSRFIVLRQQKNCGLSSTRNLGLKNAKGEYILFVDPDDYVEINLLECVDKEVGSKGYDLLTWGIYNNIINLDGREEIHLSNLNYHLRKASVDPTTDDWQTLFLKTFFMSTVNKLYRRSIIQLQQLSFDVQCVEFQDYVFNVSYCQSVQSFCIMSEAFYHYRQPINQVATLKRAWHLVPPFVVSPKVYYTTKQFIESLNSGRNELNNLMLYPYKAYFNEIEYLYRKKTWREFRLSVEKLVFDAAFEEMLKCLQQPKLKKIILPLLIMIKMKSGNLLASFLWLLERRAHGLKSN